MIQRLLWIAAFLIGIPFGIYWFTFGLAASSIQTSTWFCSSCHQMDPIITAWQHSSHKKVLCIYCHQDTGGTFGLMAANLGAGHTLLSTLEQTWKPTAIIETSIDDDTCLACHYDPIVGDKRTIKGFFQPIHWQGKTFTEWQIHAAGYHCTQCHSTVVEGNLVPVGARTHPHLPPDIFSAQLKAKADDWLRYLNKSKKGNPFIGG